MRKPGYNPTTKITKLFAPIFYIMLVGFIAFFLRDLDWSQLRGLNISWPYIVIASLFGIAGRYLGVFIWFTILRSLGAKSLGDKLNLAYVYAKSWLGRYIPTPAAWMMGKVYFASQHGISKNKLAVSSILEGALQVLVVMIVSFSMLIFDRRLDVIDFRYKVLMGVIIIVGIVLMTPYIFNKVVSRLYKILKKKDFDKEHSITNKIVLNGALLYTIGAFISGLSLFFVAKGVYPELGFENILFVMGVGNLAGAASMLAVFAPGGLGVREGIQLVLLSLIMPREIALIVTVITRLWSLAVDLLFFLSAKVLRKLF